MLAARGAMMVSRLRYRRSRSVRCWVDVAPSECVGIKDPDPSHLFYRLFIVPFTPKEIDPLPNSHGCMSHSWSWHLAILSLSQARHALVIHLSVMIPPLRLQWQRDDMYFIARQLSILVLSAKDVSSVRKDCEGVARAREKGGAGDSFKGCAERLSGLRKAVGSDGAAFDGRGEDLLGCYEAGHRCWVHLGWRWWVDDDTMPRWGRFAKIYIDW